MNSLSFSWRMNLRAAGNRSSIFSFSCVKITGGCAKRPYSKRGGPASLLRPETTPLRLSLAANSPVAWQARMRNSSMTGAWLASDSSKPFSTVRTIDGRSGRGSSSHIEDFSA